MLPDPLMVEYIYIYRHIVVLIFQLKQTNLILILLLTLTPSWCLRIIPLWFHASCFIILFAPKLLWTSWCNIKVVLFNHKLIDHELFSFGFKQIIMNILYCDWILVFIWFWTNIYPLLGCDVLMCSP